MVGGKTDLIWSKMVLPALKELTKLTFCCHRCENQVVLLRVTDNQFVTKTNINKQGFNNLRALLYFVLPANDAGPKKHPDRISIENHKKRKDSQRDTFF